MGKCIHRMGTWIVYLVFSIASLNTSSALNKPISPSPVERGAFQVLNREYDFGIQACDYQIDTGLDCSQTDNTTVTHPVEVMAIVYYPRELETLPQKTPLIVALHGGFRTCFDNTAWPCRSPDQRVSSYHGFDYVGKLLASHGYIVVSISANGLKAADHMGDDAASMLARAHLIDFHLGLWKQFDAGGTFAEPDGQFFSSHFQGRVDLDKVGLLGHSFGGQGVIEYYYRCYHGVPQGIPPLTSCPDELAAPSAIPIKAIVALAPTTRIQSRVINHVPLAVMLSYCDGDPAGRTHSGVNYFDDARYATEDMAPKYMILLLGANHNYYNRVWATDDDWRFNSPGHYCRDTRHRLTPKEQRHTGLIFIAAFFRAHLGDESEFKPLLAGDAQLPPLPFSRNIADKILVSYHAPAASRLDVNRFLAAKSLDSNCLNGSVTRGPYNRIVSYQLCGGRRSENDQQPWPKCLPEDVSFIEPHFSEPGLSDPGVIQLRIGWNGTASYQNNLPDTHRDVSMFRRLQFRVVVDFTDPANCQFTALEQCLNNPQDSAQNFTVVLVDDANQRAELSVQDYSYALYYPPGIPRAFPVTLSPRLLLNMVSMPLSAFEMNNPAIRLENVKSIRFEFDKKPRGALFITDLAFSGRTLSNPDVPDLQPACPG